MSDGVKTIKVAYADWVHRYIEDLKHQVMYLVVGPEGIRERLKEVVEIVAIAPNEEFFGFVNEHVRLYVREGKMPPTEIAAAVLNLADDQLAGRAPTLRAGDYFSLQQAFRSRSSAA